ncbi:MAG: undecaprenyldiphospho-muramoylpentapeptide beta-N-acetylglucosaminyltransferase [Gammaproteobacteria bacterium]
MSDISGKKILILSGGTGGHIIPGLSIAQALHQEGCEIFWLGSHRGLEEKLVPQAPIPIELHTLGIQGLRGKNLGAWFKMPFLLLKSVFEAYRLIRKIQPALILGMGGFAAGPGGLAAWLNRVPLIIHEQNSIAGLTNRLLSKLATYKACAFPNAFGKNSASLKNLFLTGNPVRRDIQPKHYDAAYIRQLGQRPLQILILGGSRGAFALNQVCPKALIALNTEVPQKFPNAPNIRVWHQTGLADFEMVQNHYSSHGSDGFDKNIYRTEAFIQNMAAAYDWADLIICRAGALTIAELTTVGLPCVLVPFPHAVDDHQTQNAKLLSQAQGGILLAQEALSTSRLMSLILEFIQNPSLLAPMSAALKHLAQPRATQDILDLCKKAIEKKIENQTT